MGSVVNWGVLGTAGIAKGCTIPGMQQANNCKLYAIAGRNLEKANSFKDEFGFEKAYGDFDSLLADTEVQAVYIPLPNHMHYEWVMKAIEAGKHVLCEKPLVPTAEMAKELYDAAKQKGVILMEAFAYLHTPYVAALKQELADKTIGDVQFIESAFYTQGYDLSNIRMVKEYYGGGMYDLGCYCTSLIRWLLGKNPTKIQAVAQYTDEGVDILTSGIMMFDGGVRAAFNCGMNLGKDTNCRYDRLYIRGSKGDIISDTEYNQSGELHYTVCVDGVKQVKIVSVLHNYRLEVEQLGRCILDGEKPRVSSEFSIDNIAIIEKVIKEIGY